ncbi:exodeoxyribonuclease VII small subunit [Spirochaeta africana]|uniref:Exodeoxyribonuclease 7 small subunit n=1 Tax=Spirochaeta africana (strain ATCC 700263 / DSM 8902 / Z-7692) TaxID=889378 RepID=H9UJP5_SPIAZ|nr:exodeoxyribonuclease VII small subunit [Spirochaeta africana]AFG37738.1 exonuclease VII small subunit [Spirochaeta africana DSM 8902]
MKSFEERLERLEEINEQIRSGSIPLSDATKLFEEGIKLARSLEKELRAIERRVEIVVQDSGDDDEKPVLELFPELDQG